MLSSQAERLDHGQQIVRDDMLANTQPAEAALTETYKSYLRHMVDYASYSQRHHRDDRAVVTPARVAGYCKEVLDTKKQTRGRNKGAPIGPATVKMFIFAMVKLQVRGPISHPLISLRLMVRPLRLR